MTACSILLDTNLLVLYLVGTASREYIPRHKRLQAFTVDDYDLLLTRISRALSVLVTPNTLTETSNLAAYIGEPAKVAVFQVLRSVIAVSEEKYIPSQTAAGREEFIRLGLTDAAIIEAALQEVVILTADLNLYLAAMSHGIQAINFNHLRDRYL